MKPSREIDRLTDHTCPNLQLDEDYYAQQGYPFRTCVNCTQPIPQHFAQFEHLCITCRQECLDESDVALEFCVWCGSRKETDA